ncbi:hypothetical protein D3C72_1870800 [compost metagenome]
MQRIVLAFRTGKAQNRLVFSRELTAKGSNQLSQLYVYFSVVYYRGYRELLRYSVHQIALGTRLKLYSM